MENQGNRDLYVIVKMSPSSKDLCYWFRPGCKDGYHSVQCPALFFENHKKKLDVMSAFLEDNAEDLNFMIRRMNRLVMGHVRLLQEEIEHFLSDASRDKRENSERQLVEAMAAKIRLMESRKEILEHQIHLLRQ